MNRSKPATPTTDVVAGGLCNRRRFLLGSAATAAGALLAACGSSEEAAKVAATEVPVGGGVVVGKYVITQPEEGVFHAFSAVCPHQGSKISRFEDGAMVCPKHNSHFDMTTGDVISGPARSGAEPAALSAENGELVVGS
ncbi:Rieske (2Fe-2S) protein [Corynebacterium sp. TAE3-ERU12]|uniref:Rieske (2Fe-2S) protein n=1 Tax=Corynebacterium sp. TAE3-ERU12 TaxID=2849491 RepID=UPI001C464B57|nr:Rieske (2Fe-2S) protein [Corynebacterium sp. TAE3-ERU12]MBV7294376.1 Rieske (2Fe-2S) protein [Corynebacterium sp. TAE3-ERU12]